MFSFENRVGRLIELRMSTPIGADDVKAFAAMVARAYAGRVGTLVCCSDFRGMNLLAPGSASCSTRASASG